MTIQILAKRNIVEGFFLICKWQYFNSCRKNLLFFLLWRCCPVTGQMKFNLPAEKLPALLNSLHIKKLNLFE